MATSDARDAATSEASIDALAGFLTFGLKNYAEDLAPVVREYNIGKALYDLGTKDLPPGDEFTLGSEETARLVKWWKNVAFAPPRKTEGSASSIVWKEGKDLNDFICWVRLCQQTSRGGRGEEGRRLCCRARKSLCCKARQA